MQRNSTVFYFGLWTLCGCLCFRGTASAQIPTQFALDVQPVYTLVLFDGTPFNMTGMTLSVPLDALGEMEFTFANN